MGLRPFAFIGGFFCALLSGEAEPGLFCPDVLPVVVGLPESMVGLKRKALERTLSVFSL